MHQVDKSDPEVQKYFPNDLEIPVFIDWDVDDRRIYDIFTDEIRKRRANKQSENKELEDQDILAMIQVMQMLCDCPSMVNESALQRIDWEEEIEAYELNKPDKDPPPARGSEAALRLLMSLKTPSLDDDKHEKIKRLKDDLAKYSAEKTIVFTTWGPLLLPRLSAFLDRWGINHVVYAGTDKQKQEAIDAFRNDPDVLVYLSSDSGAEGVDLPQASVLIHFNLPYDYYTQKQRQDRNNRVVSTHANTTTLFYTMVNSVEDRKKQIIATKQGYHDAVFRGTVYDDIISSRMTKQDLYYILFGDYEA